MRSSALLALALLLLVPPAARSQDGALTVGWWNVENLFDAVDDPDPRPAQGSDDEFTPGGSRKWTEDRYRAKVRNLAKVVRGLMGGDGGPDVLGLAEVENRRVLEALAAELRPAPYGVVHIDSPDARGIDVAMLYRTDRLALTTFRAVPVTEMEVPTRDILVAAFRGPAGDLVCLANHWPSRRGGVAQTDERRAAAARAARRTVDSVLARDAAADVVLMGDFNDEPQDASVRVVLGAAGERAQARPGPGGALFNPLAAVDLAGGKGTFMHRDRWDVLDQFIVSAGLLDGRGYTLASVAIVESPELLQHEGRYAGYPFPTYGGATYLGGYSDHLPILLRLEGGSGVR